MATGVPDVVRRKALASGHGDWLDALPDLLAGISQAWGLRIGRPYPDATEAFVAPVTLDDGSPAVLKLLVPRDDDGAAANEIIVLRLAGGDGCARLLRHDVDRGAMLLERLGPSLHDLGMALEPRLDILCALAARVWRPAPDCGLPTGAEKGRWLVEHITTTWEAIDHPCTERAVAHAVACAASRIAAHDNERAVLVHGDVHEWNALQAGDAYKLVDPDGLLAEAEYDLGVLMREDPLDLLIGDPLDRARRLAHRSGRDVTAIWEWGVVERVSTGLLCTKIGLQPVAAQMLAAADRIAAETDRPL